MISVLAWGALILPLFLERSNYEKNGINSLKSSVYANAYAVLTYANN